MGKCLMWVQLHDNQNVPHMNYKEVGHAKSMQLIMQWIYLGCCGSIYLSHKDGCFFSLNIPFKRQHILDLILLKSKKGVGRKIQLRWKHYTQIYSSA